MSARAEQPGRPLVWDLPVRIMHWTLVVAIAGSWATQKIPGNWFKYHVWCGYTVLVVVLTRVIWGFVGTRHARFASFVRGPAFVGRYARALLAGARAAVAGHNPLGALMVLLLLGMLLGQAVTGLFANDEIANSGPLFGYVSVARSDTLTHIHTVLAYVILAAIVLHITAAFGYLAIRGENLIMPMIDGRRPPGSVAPEETIRSSRTWLAATLAALLALLLALIVRHAPQVALGVY